MRKGRSPPAKGDGGAELGVRPAYTSHYSLATGRPERPKEESPSQARPGQAGPGLWNNLLQAT